MCGSFCSFFAESIRIFVEAKEKNAQIPCFKNALLLFLLGLATCLTRRNGIYMCFPQLLVLSFLLKKSKYLCVSMFVCTAMLLGVYYYTQYPLRIALGVEQGPMREMLSIPFQQTARYLKYYGKDVSKEERKAIEKILPIDQLAKLYKPEISDPVKNKFNENKNELPNYFKAWKSMFKKHPLVYLDATLAGSYAYFYPFTRRTVRGIYYFFIESKDKPVATGYFDFHQVFSETVRGRLYRCADLWTRIPLLWCFINPGVYAWILILCWGLFFYRKKERKSSLLFIGALLNIATCVASPVNGYVRYALPLMACAPMIIAFALHMGKKSEALAVLTATEKNNNDKNVATAVNIESGDTIKEDKNISITIDLNINLSNKIRS